MTIDLFSLVTIIIIEPEDVKVNENKITTAAGKEITIRNQNAYFKKPSRKYPEFFLMPARDDGKPYPAGMYFLAPDSFERGDYDALTLSRYDLELVPVPAEMQQQAKK